MDGRLANRIAPWGLLGVPIRLRVLDPDQTQYGVDSVDATLKSVLTEEWDHILVLSTVPV